MNKYLTGIGTLVIGFYAWVMAVFLGGILLDVIYARAMSDVFSPADGGAVFSAVSDVLLCMGGVVIPAGLGAIAAAWKTSTARWLLIASLSLVIFEFITPLLFSILVPGARDITPLPWLRIIPAGLGSLIAFSGAFYYCRQSACSG